MTKADQVALINQTIAKERNAYARSVSAEAYLNGDGQIGYRESIKGYARRATRFELFALLHGEDIRALKAAL